MCRSVRHRPRLIRFFIQFLERLSENSLRCPWSNPTGSQEVPFWPISCSAWRPNSRLRLCPSTFSDSLRRGILRTSSVRSSAKSTYRSPTYQAVSAPARCRKPSAAYPLLCRCIEIADPSERPPPPPRPRRSGPGMCALRRRREPHLGSMLISSCRKPVGRSSSTHLGGKEGGCDESSFF
jgi:hypothetical protein